MEKMNWRIYIFFGMNIELLNKAVNSIISRIGQFTISEKPVVIINNTLEPVLDKLDNGNVCVEYVPPIELVPAQEINWALKLAKENNEPFMAYFHTDAELLDGAIEDLLEKYHEVKNQKWSQILEYGSGVFACLNMDFFEQECVDYDPFMFPFYYQDNHMYKVMESRGWVVYQTRRSGENLVIHKSSHYLKENPIFSRKNNLCFPLSGMLYEQIWGGLPGKETRLDPTAGGTLRYPVK